MIKNISLVALATLLLPTFAVADDAPTNKEWASYVTPLVSMGDRYKAQLKDPNDPLLQQELYRATYSAIAQAYFGTLYQDAKHPDFWPMFNQAFNLLFPNPDDSYQETMLDDNGIYKISGTRGSVHMVSFQVGGGTFFVNGGGGRAGMGRALATYDLDQHTHVKKDGTFEFILSAERPKGWKGDWWKLPASATWIVVRQVGYDWVHEVDARLAIDRLDTPAIKPRATAAELEAGLKQIPVWADGWIQLSLDWIANLRKQDVINKMIVRDYSKSGGLSTQRYIEGLFDVANDEALILETEMPKHCRYWNFQLADEMWGSIDWTNRQSTLNGHTGKVDKDGKFRAVISKQDPGVPNWMDNAGYQRGYLYGRWESCDSYPTPTITKIKVADVRKYLPADTPVVTAEARDASIREKRRAVQMRRRW